MEDGLYEYFHICVMQYYKSSKKSQEEVHKSLDSLGFRVGYNLIERYLQIGT